MLGKCFFQRLSAEKSDHFEGLTPFKKVHVETVAE